MRVDNKVILGGAVLLIVAVVGAGFLTRTNEEKGGTKMDETTKTTPVTTPAPAGLKIEDETVGTGVEAVAGKSVTVNYLGTLTDGTKFDSSYDRNQPFTFNLGAGQVIAGWDQGVVGMKVGGKRKLTIPPELGYGSQLSGPIPANSTLVFEIELLGVN